MTAASQQIMFILVGAFAALFVIVGAVIALSKNKKPQLTTQKKEILVQAPAPKQIEDKKLLESASIEKALAQTKKNFWGRISDLWSDASLDQNIEALEEILYTSDMGPQTVQSLLEKVRKDLGGSAKNNIDALKIAIKSEMQTIFAQTKDLSRQSVPQILDQGQKPNVIMIVGVNGAGKTTSIGKISAQLAEAGKKVLVAAGDTFRAAAESQLKTWTERAQVEIFSSETSKDPSAVAYEALTKVKNQDYDFVIVDTAGRLHTQTHLMEELKKVKRVMDKALPGSPHEILIVLDANSGQNALLQAKEYHAALGLTGVILTKMDGTAKGGVAVGLAHDLKIPIKFVGIGEKIHDLKIFSAAEFIDSIM